ncbi:MAG: hypothetical protein IPP32_16900 [Bacteroidetes bacterium]|nr:hypothetical protein [Bacteroidota bacterium]
MRYLVHVFLLLALLSSCRKDEKITTDTSAKLDFSGDTVLFDTVFTTVGSTVSSLIIYNRNDKKVVVSSIKLAGGDNSAFRLNIDGVPGASASNIEISGNDSLFIFVEVTVDPNNALSPFLVNDTIVFETNGNTQDVKLVAYGQNAHYFHPDTYLPGYPAFSVIPAPGNVAHWVNDKPYVIFDYAVVDSGCALIIDPGVKVYFHKGGGLWVFPEGKIKVNGTKDMPVTFQGDRLEPFYKEEPGQWDRIWINENSTDSSEFNFAIIKNAFIGIQAEILQYRTSIPLKLNNTIIRNMSGLGIYTTWYDVDAVNTIVANCGQQLLGFTLGGNYNFTHCTLANYWSAGQRQDPAFVFNNYNTAQAPALNATFTNCILDGTLDEEFAFDLDTTGGKGKYLFNTCMLRTQKNTSNTNHYVSVFVNKDPAFADKSKNDYHLTSASFAIDKGISTTVDKDITEFTRTPPPDLGAYEFH